MSSGLIPIENQPIDFNTDIDGVDECAECEGQPFAQLVHQADTTSFQMKIRRVCGSEVNLIDNGDFSAVSYTTESTNTHGDNLRWFRSSSGDNTLHVLIDIS